MLFQTKKKFISIFLILNILVFFSFYSSAEEDSCHRVPIKDCKVAPQWLLEAQTSKAIVSINKGFVEWHAGIWEKGHWEEGIWRQGLWKTGRWKFGAWENGLWEEANWRSFFDQSFLCLRTDIPCF